MESCVALSDIQYNYITKKLSIIFANSTETSLLYIIICENGTQLCPRYIVATNDNLILLREVIINSAFSIIMKPALYLAMIDIRPPGPPFPVITTVVS